MDISTQQQRQETFLFIACCTGMNVCSSKHNTLFYQLRDNFTRNLENGTISQIQSFRLWVCLGGPGCQCRFGIEEKEFVLEELSVSRNDVGVEANEASESKTSEGSRTTAPQQRSTHKRRNSFLRCTRLAANRATSLLRSKDEVFELMLCGS